MTTTVLRVTHSGQTLALPRVACAPGTDTYLTATSDATDGPLIFARVEADGDVAWSKSLKLSAANGTHFGAVASANAGADVAVLISYENNSTFVYESVVALYNSSGTLQWQTKLPLASSDTGFPSAAIYGFAIAPDKSVYVTGTVNSDADTLLVKLNGATGAKDWSVNLRSSSVSTVINASGALVILSGGDPVVYVRGPTLPSSTSRAHIQRLSATDGSITWTRGITWGSTSGGFFTNLAVDGSDNIYCSCPEYAYGSLGSELPVVKLNSSGTELWSRNVRSTSALNSAHTFYLDWGPGVAAGSSGVTFPMNFGYDPTPDKFNYGHMTVPAAGTIATGGVNLTAYRQPSYSGTQEAAGAVQVADAVTMAYDDTVSGTGRIMLVRSEPAAGDDSNYGGSYTRATYALDLIAGQGASSTQSYTRATNPSFSVSSASISSSSPTITAAVMQPTSVATGIASTATFTTTAYMVGVQLPYTITTAFGSVSGGRGVAATGLGSALAFGLPTGFTTQFATGRASTLAFGTAVYTINSSRAATSIESTLDFGQAQAERGLPPPPIIASSVESTLAFGLPSATRVRSATASGFSTTAFGSPTLRLRLTASGFSTTALGSPTHAQRGLASGWRGTAFGTAKAQRYGLPAGFSTGVEFGLPVVRNRFTCVATGFTSTALGSPLCGSAHSRTRSGVFRTRFGLAQAERTAP